MHETVDYGGCNGEARGQLHGGHGLDYDGGLVTVRDAERAGELVGVEGVHAGLMYIEDVVTVELAQVLYAIDRAVRDASTNRR